MNILFPQPVEVEAVQRLEKAGHIVVTSPDPKHETVLPLMKNAHAVILRTGIFMTRELIEAADDLRVISRTGGGFDNVDIQAATENDVIVTSNLGINTISVCEHVLAMMRAPVKRLPRELHLVIGNLNSAVSGSYGVAGVKYASEVAGFRGGEPRLPLLPLQDSDKESIRRAIEATDFSSYI